MNDSITIEDVLHDPRKDFCKIFDLTDVDNEEPIRESHNCQYYTINEYLDYLRKETISDKTHLKVLSLNIANLLAKLSSFKVFLETISNTSNRPNIIAVTETHLHNFMNHGYTSLGLQNLLPGYKFFHEDRKTKRGGGVGLFIENILSDNAKQISKQ